MTIRNIKKTIILRKKTLRNSNALFPNRQQNPLPQQQASKNIDNRLYEPRKKSAEKNLSLENGVPPVNWMEYAALNSSAIVLSSGVFINCWNRGRQNLCLNLSS